MSLLKRLPKIDRATNKTSFFIFISLIFGIFSLLNANQNWDSIGYASVVEGYAHNNGAVIHAHTYNQLRESTDAHTFVNLTSANSFEKAVWQSPELLVEMRGAYSPKYLYLVIIRLLVSFKLNVFLAMKLTSAFFGSGSLLLVLLISRKHNTGIRLTLFLVSLSGLFEISRMSTPDAMACFFVLLIFLNYRKEKSISQVLLFILPLIRPELAILSVAILFRVSKRLEIVTKFLGTFFILLECYCIGVLQHAWSVTKSVNFLIYLQNQSDVIPYFSENFQSKEVAKSIYYAFCSGSSLLLLLFISQLTVFRIKRDRVNYFANFVSALILYVVVRIIVFPSLDFRFFTPVLILLGIFFVQTLNNFPIKHSKSSPENDS